jgi:hypothetical protein
MSFSGTCLVELNQDSSLPGIQLFNSVSVYPSAHVGLILCSLGKMQLFCFLCCTRLLMYLLFYNVKAPACTCKVKALVWGPFTNKHHHVHKFMVSRWNETMKHKNIAIFLLQNEESCNIGWSPLLNSGPYSSPSCTWSWDSPTLLGPNELNIGQGPKHGVSTCALSSFNLAIMIDGESGS